MSNIQTTHLVLLIAATWRLANLLANEDGPFHAIKKLRSKIARIEVKSRRKDGFISKLHLYEGVNCEYCNSVWFGSLFTVLYLISPNVALTLALPLALSTGAILIKKVVFVLGGIDTYFDKLNNPIVQVNRVVAEKQPIEPQGKAKWDALFEKQVSEKGGI
jgi:hypothetical protein